MKKELKNLKIERKDAIEKLGDLMDSVFVKKPQEGGIFALNGPHEIGKTTFVTDWYKQWEQAEKSKNVYAYFYRSWNVDPWKFWKKVIEDFSEIIYDTESTAGKKIEKVYQYFWESDGSYDKVELTEKLLELLINFKKLGIHIILALDEFDNIQVEKEDTGEKEKKKTEFLEILYKLSPAKNSEGLYFTVLLISRRSVGMLTDSYKDFVLAVDAKEMMSGFSNSELSSCVFKINNMKIAMMLENQMENSGNLENASLRRIFYYCGRHPGLLQAMYKKLYMKGKGCGFQYDVDCLYHDEDEVGGKLHAIFEKIYGCLKTEKIGTISAVGGEDAEDITALGAFVQAFIGPVYERLELPAFLREIRNRGLIMRTEIGEDTYAFIGKNSLLTDLRGFVAEEHETCPANLEDIQTKKEMSAEEKRAEIEDLFRYKLPNTYAFRALNKTNNVYEAMSPFFIEYVKKRVKDEFGQALFELSKVIHQTEYTIRQKIVDVYKVQYPGNWRTELENKLSSQQKVSYNSLKADCLENGVSEEEYTPADVMNFTLYAKIIKENWGELSGDFRNYKANDGTCMIKKLQDEFEVLRKARNYFAHLTSKVLMEEQVATIRTICEELNKAFDDEEASSLSEAAAAVESTGTGVSQVQNGTSAVNNSNVAPVNVNAATTRKATAQKYADIVARVGSGNTVEFTCKKKTGEVAKGQFEYDGLIYDARIQNSMAGFSSIRVNQTSLVHVVAIGTDSNNSSFKFVKAKPVIQ